MRSGTRKTTGSRLFWFTGGPVPNPSPPMLRTTTRGQSTKDEEEEQRIERILLDAGYRFQKSEDNYIQESNMWVIYYEVN